MASVESAPASASELDFRDISVSDARSESLGGQLAGNIPKPSPPPANASMWGFLFETEEDDETENKAPLLQELDIDFSDIFLKIKLIAWPFGEHASRSMAKDPDFWGPLFSLLVYASCIVWGQFSVISWILIIWVFGSFLIFFLTRAIGGEVSYATTLGVIGYAIIPIIVTVLLLPILNKISPWLAFAMKIKGVVWASYSSGSLLIDPQFASKRPLLMYPIALLYIYFLSLHSGV
eukprot:TRINITY_DN555_c0_g1_i1.p1 TRINITY_DN555_c0_g1~~TRINITY_DN555_c0_g1_i1.p1  ORF type:complete len:254 (-),score=69.13 TRINITY_DN555_c0_g1_i1:201-905(-)